MSTHNIGFYEDLSKIIFNLSSNMHIISSSANRSIKMKICMGQANILHHTVREQPRC